MTLKKFRPCDVRGLTLLEVVIIIAVIALFALLIPAPNSHDRQKAVQISCANNLKMVGLAFRIWEGDCSDDFPMRRYKNAAGEPLYMDATDMFIYFQVMSNELSNPQVLACPQDKNHRPATNFTTDFNSSRISYFVGMDADETEPQRFLVGDSNFKTDVPFKNGLLELTTNHFISWTKERHGDSGNIVLSDGSVLAYSSAGLKAALQKAGLATNRLLFPP